MTKYLPLLGALLFSSSAADAIDKPDKGKIRVYVMAETTDEEGVAKPNAEDLANSVKDINKRLKKKKWIEPAETEESAEMILRVLDRRKDKHQGNVIRYKLTAGEFEAEDTYGAVGLLEHAGGSMGHHDADGGELPIVTSSSIDRKATDVYYDWKTIADGMARTLNHFAEQNYQRLIAIRESKKP